MLQEESESRARVCYMTLSDVTEANRKPSKRRRYNSIYLSERERKGKGKKENAKEREGFVTSSARWRYAQRPW